MQRKRATKRSAKYQFLLRLRWNEVDLFGRPLEKKALSALRISRETLESKTTVKNLPRTGSGTEAKHRKSLPNGRRQEPPRGRRRRRRLVVFHLVRISYVSASLPKPILVRFSSKLAGSVNFPRGLPKRSSSFHLRIGFFKWSWSDAT